MKKFQYGLIFCVIIVIGIFTATNSAFGWGEMKKAKEYIEASMFPQAQAILEKEITENPKNAEAHYQLAICYVHLKYHAKAEERFKSAMGLKPEYGEKVGGVYLSAAMIYLNNENIKEAKDAFDQAVRYQPNLGKTIAQECLKRGQARLEQGKYLNAEGYLSLTQIYDRSLIQRLAELYYSTSQKAQPEDSLNLLKKASQIDKKFETELGKKYLVLANSQNSLEKRSLLINEATKYKVTNEELIASSIEYYAKIWGEPRKLELKEKKFEYAGTVAEYKRIRFLSLHDFWMKSEKTTKLWTARTTSNHGIEFRYSDMEGKDTPVHFGMNNEPTIVYYWIEK